MFAFVVSVEDIVIDPAPVKIEIFVPAVIGDNTYPPLEPINNCPFAGV